MVLHRSLPILVVLVLATSADADITKLGDIALGQPGKTATVKTTVFGCAGEIRTQVDRAKKVTYVELLTGACNRDAIAAAITKETGITPIPNADGAKLWEGTTASLILQENVVRLVPPGAGSKRVCWPDDGFVAFYTRFRAAVKSSNGTSIAASFAIPLKDYSGKVRFNTAKKLASAWTKLINGDDVSDIAEGTSKPRCSYEDESYRLRLPDSYGEIIARRINGMWKWVEYNEMSPG